MSKTRKDAGLRPAAPVVFGFGSEQQAAHFRGVANEHQDAHGRGGAGNGRCHSPGGRAPGMIGRVRALVALLPSMLPWRALNRLAITSRWRQPSLEERNEISRCALRSDAKVISATR